MGHLYGRKGKQLEDYLDDAMAALVTGVVAVKHRLTEEAEREWQRELGLHQKDVAVHLEVNE